MTIPESPYRSDASAPVLEPPRNWKRIGKRAGAVGIVVGMVWFVVALVSALFGEFTPFAALGIVVGVGNAVVIVVILGALLVASVRSLWRDGETGDGG